MKLGYAFAAAGMLATAAFAGVQSGLKPGTTPGAFQVVDVNGPNKGKQLCYRCSYGIAPVLAVFVNGEVSKAGKLMTEVQQLSDARKEKGLKTFVVFMGGPDLKEPIQKLATERKITVPMVFLPSGASDEEIASYKINPAAKNTVLLWRGSVRSNFVDVTPASFSQVEKAVDQMLQQ